MTIKYVVKRDGTKEKFDVSKILKWELWACSDLKEKIDWKRIIASVVSNLEEGITTRDIQNKLIEVCNNNNTWTHSLISGRLYGSLACKDIYNSIPDKYKDNEDTKFSKYPTVKNLHEFLQNKGLMVSLSYTDEEYREIENIIDHGKNFDLAYFQFKHIVYKYGLSDKPKHIGFETPQFIFMRMAMVLSEDEENRLEKVAKFYKYLSEFKMNAPTPNYTNLGTSHNGYISCCLYHSGDSAASLAIGDHIAYTMTYMSSGIGCILNTRSISDGVKNGLISHMGKLPYFNALSASVNANLQSSRGGACTTYFSCFDPEVIDIIYLQNPRTPISKQNRGIHFAFSFNSLFVEKAYKDQDIFTFNIHTAPDLVNAFYSGDPKLFKKLYKKYEEDTTFKKNYINARKIALDALRQAHEVATLYFFNVDEVNRHTSFKENIYSSNLCVSPDTKILTKEYGYKKVKVLLGQDIHVWNGQTWSKTKVIKTSEGSELYKVKLSDGSHIKVTPYHKWYIKRGGQIVEKRTHELVFGDSLIDYDLPIIDHGNNILDITELNKDSFIPSNSYKLSSRVGWFLNKLKTKGNKSYIKTKDRESALNIYLMFQELGIYSYIEDIYVYIVPAKDNATEVLKRTIVSIESSYSFEETYCVREPKRNMVMFNGILTGNCLEITQPTKPYEHMEDLYSSEDRDDKGEISLCALGGIIPSNIDSDEEYEDVAYYTLLMIDKCIHKNNYIFPHLKTTALKRLNAGVGLIGLAYDMAKNEVSYRSKAGLRFLHKLVERHSYYVIKASLRLGKEKGNAEWMHKTKWPEGWLPIDTYNKEIDNVTNFKYHYDWETLREEIKKNKGIRNSALLSYMPTESSSKATGLPNGVYPIRDFYLKKTDSSNAIDFIVKEYELLKDYYDFAWDLTPEDLCRFYSVIQKFSDQSISADFYIDRSKEPDLKATRLLEEFFYMYKYGVKTRYYTNSKTTEGLTLDSQSNPGCSGGSCTL